jgi:hypothetical protein
MSKYPRIHPAREERAHDFRAEIGQPNIAGRLGRNQAPVGALISVAGAPMNTLVQLDPIYVTFNPSETDLVVIQTRHGGELTFISKIHRSRHEGVDGGRMGSLSRRSPTNPRMFAVTEAEQAQIKAIIGSTRTDIVV